MQRQDKTLERNEFDVFNYFQVSSGAGVPTRSEEAAPPPAAEAPPPAGWRSFSFPSDHVLLLGCSGDEFTVRIMPLVEGMEQHNLRQANGDPAGRLPPAGSRDSVQLQPRPILLRAVLVAPGGGKVGAGAGDGHGVGGGTG